MQKTAIVILSDPNAGEEALGRLFNALFLAYELKERGAEFDIVFQSTGTRWPAELVKPDHPANALYGAVQEKVAGASCGCANVFGAAEGVESAGLDLVSDAEIPGTPGVFDLSRYLAEGGNLVTF